MRPEKKSRNSVDMPEGTEQPRDSELPPAQLMPPRPPAGVPAELTIPIIAAVASALDYAHKRAYCAET